MPNGPSTGLPYNDWFTQTPSWEIVDIVTKNPLKFNEAIVLAMDERFDGLGELNGRPTGTGTFRNIADIGTTAKASTAQQVRTINVTQTTNWIDYTIDSGVYHANAKIAQRWTEAELAENISTGFSFSNIQPGDTMKAQWPREQYDTINRHLWFDVSVFRTTTNEPDDGGESLDVDTTTESGFEDIVSRFTALEIRVPLPAGGIGRNFGVASSDVIATTVGAFDSEVPDPVVSVGPLNETGQTGFFNRGSVIPSRDVQPFDLTKAFDHYLFTHSPREFFNRFSTNDFDSALNDTFKETLAFSATGWPGVQNTAWTYIKSTTDGLADSNLYFIGIPSPLFSSDSGYQIGIQLPVGLVSVIKDPIQFAADNAVTVESLTTNGVMVVRCDISSGFIFLDPAINPSASVSLPSPIASST